MNKLTDTIYGKMLYNEYDTCIGKSLELYGEWAQEEIEFLKPYIPRGGVCIDVGANIGTHTLAFANAVGPEGTVASFEPERINFQLLCANIALNQCLNIWTFPFAVGETSKTVRFPHLNYNQSINFGMVTEIKEGGYFVKAYPLDHLELPCIDLIKIDVEGQEPEVILGAKEIIRQYQPFIYAEFHPKDQSQDLVKLIQNLDYDVYVHKAAAFRHNNFKMYTTDVFGGYVESNIFCVPKSKQIKVDLPRI